MNAKPAAPPVHRCSLGLPRRLRRGLLPATSRLHPLAGQWPRRRELWRPSAAPVLSNSCACDPACLWRSEARAASPRRRYRDLKRSSQKISTLRSRMSTGSSLPARFQSTAPSFAPSTFTTSSFESLPSRSGSQTPLPVSAGAESLTDAKAARELGGARRAAHRCPSRQRACLHSAGCTQPFSRSALTTSHTALTTWQPCPSMCDTG